MLTEFIWRRANEPNIREEEVNPVRRTYIAVLSCAAVLIAGCSSGDSDRAGASSTSSSLDREAADRSAAAASASASSASAAASRSAAAASSSAAAASSSAAAAAPKAPGTTVSTATHQSVTYYSMQRPTAASAPAPQEPGTEWVAIDVQTCYEAGAQDFDNSHSWVLVDANNGNYAPSSTGYSQFPAPKFPWGDISVVPGQCIRGWIVFPVVIGAPVINVAFMPYGARTPVLWTA
jgi:hypothetical protein